ncbi:hypothetical protein [Nocardioides campestrisoli]|uniref:hypothetical protein n=1 Tax=Nocardioides campestrisoli TaxID=2736757 RepID=UPI0015E7A977|nr:hypothetical protein [Nocardioides campestrisoli]
MVTVDLTAPPPAPTPLVLEGLPRRIAVTLPELRLLATAAGGAPLPFDEPTSAATHALDARLGTSTASTEDAAYAAALAALHDPAETLSRRGLLGPGGAEPGVLGAVGLLATPELALEIDLSAGGTRVKSWHREAGGAVATLGTVDGVVFELSWFAADQWASELARVPVPPEDLRLQDSAVPELLSVPYTLVDAVGEAVKARRTDLVPVLVAQRSGAVKGADDVPLDDATAATALAALHGEAQGRLRVLAARVGVDRTTPVGVVSWTLLADGWHALLPRHTDQEPRLELRRVAPDELATTLAPVLAEVSA